MSSEPFIIPQEFVCPISNEIFKDPVIAQDGHTYEKQHIQQWLQSHATSPMTRQPISSTSLIPNIALRNSIEQIMKRLNENNTPYVLPTSNEVIVPSEINSHLNAFEDDILTCNITATPLADDETCYVNVTLTPPANHTRTPTLFVCVVDVSGSMQLSDSNGNSDNNNEQQLSRLQLVRHSLTTLVSVLEPADSLAIVKYSDTASTVLEITQMDPSGVIAAKDIISKLCTEGSTNLWDGIRVGLNITDDPKFHGQNVVTLILTDGEPTIVPPRGHIPTLKSHLEKILLTSTVHTFGYGYVLDSELLLEIAEIGNGSFSFIPDATMVGTVFVNYISNSLCNAVKQADISIQAANDAEILAIYAHPDVKVTTGHDAFYNIKMGAVQYGQSRNLVLKMKVKNPESVYLHATVRYQHQQRKEIPIEGVGFSSNVADIYAQLYRSLFIDAVAEIIKLNKKTSSQQSVLGSHLIKDLIDRINNDQTHVSHPHVEALLKDLTGQVSEAVSRADWYVKWGKHYLRSLARAHMFQQCSNFKDPGVQVYGGALFKELQSKLDDVFCSLPPPAPEPSYYDYGYGGGYGQGYGAPSAAPAPSASFSMRSYYNSNNVCFDGSSTVQLQDGTVVKICDTKKGDVVRCANNQYASILCVVKTVFNAKHTQLVSFENGLKVTPWHPICIDGTWKFPADIQPAIDTSCDAVYNFVLDKSHIVLVNNVQCCTLGHGLNDAVVQHEYFGTNAIIQDLQRFPGWSSGLVELLPEYIHRDSQTGLICSIHNHNSTSKSIFFNMGSVCPQLVV